MQYLGIDKHSQLIYQGNSMTSATAVWPTPVVTPAKFIWADDQEIKPAAKNTSLGFENTIFREDSFDPIARIRRGRFYSIISGSPEQDWWVLHAPPVHAYGGETDINMPGMAKKSAYTYSPFSISGKMRTKIESQLLIALGCEQASSLWMVINVESTHVGEELVTLKARQSFGVLPEMDRGQTPINELANIQEALQTLEDDYYIASPESVVDRANEAATRVLNAYLQAKGKSLQDTLSKITTEMSALDSKDRREVARNAADIVRLLHGRTKYAVQKIHNARPIREQDAELAVQCVGVMLCDLGWGSWT